jgi:hypothetical protein
VKGTIPRWVAFPSSPKVRYPLRSRQPLSEVVAEFKHSAINVLKSSGCIITPREREINPYCEQKMTE